MKDANEELSVLDGHFAPSLNIDKMPPANRDVADVIAPTDVDTRSAEAMLPTSERFDTGNVSNFVQQYLAAEDVKVRFDGTLFIEGQLLRADTPDQVDAYLDIEQLTERDLLDRIVVFAFNEGYEHKKGLIEPALRQELGRLRRVRYKQVMRPLLQKNGFAMMAEAKDEWRKLGSLFEMSEELAAAVLGHFIWQVKQKARGGTVTNHLMAIIYSAVQGTGKTFFLRKLVGPLQELASADALLSDFADRRSADIFRFMAVIIDDMEEISGSAVPIIKSVVTSERLSRRKLHTSLTTTTRQRSTLIGTANRPVHELIDDDTGHRRFAMLPFRNGNPSKGGDQAVWKTVENLRYDILWKSVDAFGDSPIEPFLDQLHKHQNADRPVPPLLSWLRRLDPNEEKIKAISVPRGVRADALHELFEAETGEQISKQRFAAQMAAFMSEEDTPFSDKIRPKIGAVYVMKRLK